MPLSPEIRTIPEMIAKFNRANLTLPLINDLIRGKTDRDLVEDSRKIIKEYEEKGIVDVTGIDNIPKDSGSLIVFNHPNMDVLLPAILTLMVKVKDNGGHETTLLMGGEIPLLGRFNETYPLPGSISLITRFHALYPKNIISVPMSTGRKDYESGRMLAVRRAVNALRNGNIVMVAPEGHVEMNNTISPTETFHSGSGGLSRLASKMGLSTVPVGIWETEKEGLIRVNIGKPFMVNTNNNEEAVGELMSKIAVALPEELGGPFGH